MLEFLKYHNFKVFLNNSLILRELSGFEVFSSCTWSARVLHSNTSHIVFFSLFFIIFICAYNVWVISPPFPLPSLLPLPCSLPYHPNPSLPGRNYFALISTFVEERV
jgi:hypothetical protein